MSFLKIRNVLMQEPLKWSRKHATIATRLSMGVDTWETIAMCKGFRGTPLLSEREEYEIRIWNETVARLHLQRI